MEENNQLQELMLRIEQSNRKQTKFAKWQCIFSAVAAVSCVAVLMIVVCLLPRLGAMVTQAETVIADVQQVTSQLAQADWEGLTSDLESVSQQIANANLDGIAKAVSELVKTSQSGLEEALGKLNAIDLEALNKAIKDLSAVIEPLARLSKLF